MEVIDEAIQTADEQTNEYISLQLNTESEMLQYADPARVAEIIEEVIDCQECDSMPDYSGFSQNNQTQPDMESIKSSIHNIHMA